MIILKTISAKNFLSIGDQPTVIRLDKSITTVVTGKNGGGKSTLIDMIVFCIFGKPFRKVRVGQLVNKVNERELVTECEFSIGSNNYKVIRGQKPAIFEIYTNGVLIPQPANTADYQHILENDILKLNYKTFTQIIILGSASFVPFMQLPLASRREIIENILDISVFTEMNDILKVKIKELDQEIVDIQHQLDLTKSQYKLKYDFFQTLKHDNEERIIDLNGKIVKLEDELKILKERESDLVLLIADTTEKLKDYNTLNDDIKRINNEKAEAEKIIVLKKHELEKCLERNTRIDELGTKINSNKETVVLLDKDIKDLQNAEKIVNEKLKEYPDKSDRLRELEKTVTLRNQAVTSSIKKINFFDNNVGCPECGHDITDDERVAAVMAENEIIDNSQKDILKCNNEIIEIKEDAKKRADLFSENIKIGKDIATLSQKIEMVKSNIDNDTATRESLLSITYDIDDIKLVIGRNECIVSDKINELKTYDEKLVEYKTLNDKLTALNQKSLVCTANIRNTNESIEAHRLSIEKINNEPPSDITQEVLDELSEKIKELDVNGIKKKHFAKYYGIVRSLLKDDGVKTNIVSQYLPIINATLNMYLDKMDFPVNFEFDENFNETIRSKFRDDFSYHSFSEGEKSRIDLALLFTWRDVALKKSRNSTNILIFDEIMDGSLDSAGIENFMKILGLSDNNNVFVISHKTDVIDAQFDRNLIFGKEGHFSVMTEC